MISGRCECGNVRYEVDSDIIDFSHCHCSQCRRLHGAAFASFAGVARNAVRYTSGEEYLTSYASSPSSDRVFCKHCGSNILVDYKPDPEFLYITMGTVDGNPELPPGYHQFVSSRAPWYKIHDTLAQHDDWP